MQLCSASVLSLLFTKATLHPESSVCLRLSLLSIGTPPVPVVPVAPVLISVPPLISARVAVLVRMFMVCVASVLPVMGWRRSAAVTAPVWGLAPPTSSGVGLLGLGLLGVPSQASGAQSVEQEAFVGAP